MTTTAKVYIWYPNDGMVGHASMHIGAQVNAHGTNWYVSWWPDDGTMAAGGAGPTVTCSAQPRTFAYDKSDDGEGSKPHVIYKLTGLDIAAMKAEWDGTKNKANAHYRFLPKNCSTIVARILRAGGADKMLSAAARLSYAHNVYWTPKNVAQFCNQLCDAGNGTKHKNPSCPGKLNSVGAVLLGLR